MRGKTAKDRIAILSCVLFFIFRLAARLASVAYSSAATDILYMDGSLPAVLDVLRQGFVALSVGVAIAGLCAAAKDMPSKTSLSMTLGFCLVALADAASAFVLDVSSGAVKDALLWIALILDSVTFLFEAVLLWILYAISRSPKTAVSPNRSVLLASSVHMIWYLAMETAYLIQVLGEIGFSLSALPITEILISYLKIVLWQGVAVWLIAALLLRVWQGKKHNIHQ